VGFCGILPLGGSGNNSQRVKTLKRLLILTFLILLGGCNNLNAAPTPTNVFSPIVDISGYADLVITLERTPCFGTCPAYTLKIFGDGTGIYEGKFSVQVTGIQNFTLYREQLDQLVKAFEAARYFSLKDDYTISVTDMPSTMTSITFQGYSKAVGHYGPCLDHEAAIAFPEGRGTNAAPIALCDLEDKIDEIVNTQQWIGK
jgi:hypothetical protein